MHCILYPCIIYQYCSRLLLGNLTINDADASGTHYEGDELTLKCKIDLHGDLARFAPQVEWSIGNTSLPANSTIDNATITTIARKRLVRSDNGRICTCRVIFDDNLRVLANSSLVRSTGPLQVYCEYV